MQPTFKMKKGLVNLSPDFGISDFLHFRKISQCLGMILGGVETGSMYVQYVQGILPNVPACTAFIELSDMKHSSIEVN